MQKTKKKRYVIGIGYPWFSDAFTSFGPQRQTNHGLGSIKLYTKSFDMTSSHPEIVMLDPKGQGNWKKYKLILEEI